MDRPHGAGGPCHVCARLCDLHVADVAVAVESLTVRERRSLAGLAGLPADGRLAGHLTRACTTLASGDVHEVARLLLGRLVEAADGVFGDPGVDLRVAVARLAQEWPPALVVLFVELAWDAAGLPAEALDRESLERIDPTRSG